MARPKPGKLKRIFFTVTNDLNYDQRMKRICHSLASLGFDVTLVGRKLPGSAPLNKEIYKQERLSCWFKKGKLFYAEYNLRLFLFLLSKKMDAICAVDLDTILPCLRISRIKKIPRIYDAHELFTELKEVITRPSVHKVWQRIERSSVPQFSLGYTVSEGIAEEFKRRYDVAYQTIRNMPVLRNDPLPEPHDKFILYQGAVNEARGFEYLVPAMKWVDCKLVICGDGNYMSQLRKLVADHKMQDKIVLKGMLSPEKLWQLSINAYIGVAIAEKQGLNQYLALPNKFFDYIHAGLPQVTMDYPEYRKINQDFEVALLISEPEPKRIADAINKLLQDNVVYARLRANCLRARLQLNWQNEEKKLASFYQSIWHS